MATADQRHCNRNASIADIAAKVRITGGRVPEDLFKPMTCQLRLFVQLFTGICSSQKSWPGGLEDKKGASQDVRGVCSDNHHDSMTIMDNVLIVGESAGG
jgi:hypothetical protein